MMKQFQVVMDGRLLTYNIDTATGFSRLVKNEKYKGPRCPVCHGTGFLN